MASTFLHACALLLYVFVILLLSLCRIHLPVAYVLLSVHTCRLHITCIEYRSGDVCLDWILFVYRDVSLIGREWGVAPSSTVHSSFSNMRTDKKVNYLS